MPPAPCPQPTPAELSREAMRVLPHLEARGRLLAPIDATTHGVLGRRRKRRPYVTVDAAMVSHFARAELIAPREPGAAALILSPIGAAFLARMRANGDPFATQHRALVPAHDVEAADAVPDRNAAESPLGWLRMRKGPDGQPYLSAAEVAAGERLRRDFTLALMTPKVTAAWPLERVDYSRRADFSPIFDSERANAARRRFWTAIDAAGPELAPVVVAMCCHLQGLEAVEAKLDLPKRSCKTVLKLALALLARHNGLVRRDAARSLIRGRSFGELPEEGGGGGRGVVENE